MSRFTETTDIRPAPTVQYDSSSLIGKLDQFSRDQAQIHAQKTAERAFEKGQEYAISGGTPEFKSVGFFGSVEAKAYNKGLQAAYIASIDRDSREEISRLVAEAPDDLSFFNDNAESYRKSLLSNIDPSARIAVADSLDSIISANRIKVQNNEIAKTHKENALAISNHVELATRDALAFARDGNDMAAGESALAAILSISSAVDSGFISKEDAATQVRAIERSLVEEKVKGGIYRKLDSDGIQPAYDELSVMADSRQQGFTPDEWDKVIADTQTELNRRVARMERDAIASAKQKKIEQEFSDIERRYKEGDDTVIINPKAADAYYQQVLAPRLQAIDSREVRLAEQAQFIDRIKLIPDSLVKQVTNAANSNNPDLLAEAAMLIDRIDETPGVVNKIPTDQQAYIDTVVGLMANMEPSEAVAIARKATDPKDKARIESAKEKIKAIKKDNPKVYEKRAVSAFSGMLPFSSPDINPLLSSQMEKEYGEIAEAYMLAGADEGSAFKKADNMIKRTWGVSEVMGDAEVMKYPPENFYSIDGDVDWIKPQLMMDISDEFFGGMPDKVMLVPNDRTARDAATGRPSYGVVGIIDGVPYPIVRNWAPDYDGEIEKRKKEKTDAALERRLKRLEKPITGRTK